MMAKPDPVERRVARVEGKTGTAGPVAPADRKAQVPVVALEEPRAAERASEGTVAVVAAEVRQRSDYLKWAEIKFDLCLSDICRLISVL
jgi:hypothetical protein